MRNAIPYYRPLVALALALGAACSDRQVMEVRYGDLVVNVTGLDGGPTPDVTIIGPSGTAQTLTGSKTFSDVTPGRYDVAAAPVASSTTRWVPTPASQVVTVAGGGTGTANIAYAIVTSRVALVVAGLPANVPASITVTGPNGYVRTAPRSDALDLLDPGTYTITAADVHSGDVTYRPTPATQSVVLVPSAAATTVTVTYAVGSGSLAVTVGGLPSGLSAAVTVRGPAGFTRDLQASTTLAGLDPGAYTLTAAPRTTGDGQAIYSAPGAQVVNVGAGASAAATVTYAELGLAYQAVVSGLASPTFLTAPAGDARLFIVEQPGRIRVVRNGALLAAPFLDIASRVASGGERGLLSMAFDPAYATNGFFYVYFTNTSGDITVERYGSTPGADVAAATPTPVITIPHRDASNHNGGLVAFGPDGMLYLATGDGGGGGDPSGNGQNTNVLLGKLLRLDVRTLPYTIPASNPFAGQAGRRGEIWAYGLRNPWRYDFDGDALYIADVGQNQYEEIDVAPASLAGVNYGWNVTEGAHCYAPATGCSTAGIRPPVAEYDHGKGCSITGGFVYRGAALPELAGHYFYSDYCTGFLASLSGDASRGFTSRAWSTPNAGNVLSFGEDGAGELYVLTADGAVRRIVRR